MQKQLAIEPAPPVVEPDYMGADGGHDLDEDSDSDDSDETNQWEPTDVGGNLLTVSKRLEWTD